MTHVKICCISSLDEARLAVDAGASALGLVSHMPSGPGVIDEGLIAEIAAETPAGIETFLLTSLVEADAIVAQHERTRTTTIQLVDALVSEELGRLREALPEVKLVQVIHVRGADAIEEAQGVEPYVDTILLDSGNPDLSVKELGGTGRTHDWDVSRRLVEASALPVFLAGGLGPDNVAEAIGRVRPFGVDLCSGVRTDGALDEARLARFMAAVRGANDAPGADIALGANTALGANIASGDADVPGSVRPEEGNA